MRNRIVRAPGFAGREVHFHRRRFAVVGERDFLGAEDASGVFDVERHGRAAEAVLRDDDVDREVRALQHLARRADAADLDVVAERLAVRRRR